MIKILSDDKGAAGTFFRSCMNTDRVEKVCLAPMGSRVLHR
jgi:hypothetical protein